MAKYYYLKASLPYIEFGKEPPITAEEFISECSKWLDGKALQILINTRLNNYEFGKDETLVSKEWKEFDTDLRKEIAPARVKGQGSGERLTARVKRILAQENPLEAEKESERIRWEYLEDKEILCEFDLNDLIIYFLKLQIAARLHSFNKDEGEGLFYKLCEVGNEQTKG
ncbi:MAG: DUF2764 family protein [Candidatus Aadella gelida]|nr:DUF2764 family protein [Candidatus Aadella gelida]